MGRVIVTHSRGWHALAMVRSLGRQGVEVFCGEEAPFAKHRVCVFREVAMQTSGENLYNRVEFFSLFAG